MKEKIEWYQEVLELEPGSKVFFPLARLLADSGQLDKAAQTLRHGLDRHPEFIEARLYLIDLLFRHGRLEQCEDQVAHLAPLFSRYEGFWQAWGSSAAASGKDGDTGLALKFLAAAFQQRSLSLATVLSRGLESVLTQQASSTLVGAEAPVQMPPADAIGSPQFAQAAGQPSVQVPIQASSLASTDTSTQAPRGPVPSSAVAAVLSPVADLVQSLPTEPYMASASQAFTAQASSAGAGRVDLRENDEAYASGAMTMQNAPPVDFAQDEARDDMDMQDDGDEVEERFSLRTRSMAEVLAEQGDFAGALEIYQELSSQASSPEEAADLQYRISTLTAHLGAAQEPAPAPEPVTSPGKHRVLTVLEALAERLENRVHG